MTFDITKCKPFDLERALAGDKVVTRDGREVTEIHQFKTLYNKINTVAVVISGNIYLFTEKGEYNVNRSSGYDLFMAPKTNKFEAWVNVYSYGIACVTYNSEREAIDCAGTNYIKTIKIETEIEL